jgi:hypothetical protein
MQNLEQMDSEVRELTGADLETIDGGSFWGTVVHVLHTIFGGPGDHRRPLERP